MLQFFKLPQFLHSPPKIFFKTLTFKCVNNATIEILVLISGENLQNRCAGDSIFTNAAVIGRLGEHRLVIIYINDHYLYISGVGHLRDAIVCGTHGQHVHLPLLPVQGLTDHDGTCVGVNPEIKLK